MTPNRPLFTSRLIETTESYEIYELVGKLKVDSKKEIKSVIKHALIDRTVLVEFPAAASLHMNTGRNIPGTFVRRMDDTLQLIGDKYNLQCHDVFLRRLTNVTHPFIPAERSTVTKKLHRMPLGQQVHFHIARLKPATTTQTTESAEPAASSNDATRQSLPFVGGDDAVQHSGEETTDARNASDLSALARIGHSRVRTSRISPHPAEVTADVGSMMNGSGSTIGDTAPDDMTAHIKVLEAEVTSHKATIGSLVKHGVASKQEMAAIKSKHLELERELEDYVIL